MPGSREAPIWVPRTFMGTAPRARGPLIQVMYQAPSRRLKRVHYINLDSGSPKTR